MFGGVVCDPKSSEVSDFSTVGLSLQTAVFVEI